MKLLNTEKWPDSVRLKMIEKSEFYHNNESVYQYGFYDAYQLQNDRIEKAMRPIPEDLVADSMERIGSKCGDNMSDYALETIKDEMRQLVIQSSLSKVQAKDLLSLFWQSSSDACPVEATVMEEQERLFAEFVDTLYSNPVNA